MDNDHSKVMEKGVGLPGAEVFESSTRKSSRLQSKKKLSSCSKYAFKSHHSNSKYAKKSPKASLCKENSFSEGKIQEEKKHHFPHRNEINDVFLTKTASMKSSTVVPSFEYHVQAKDGIRLVVDLNLKRSDWLKSIEKAVCVCQNHSNPAFESFRKEVECLRDRNNLNLSLADKTSASDASMNSCVQNKNSSKSLSREIGKTLPSVVEQDVITVSGSERCWSKVDQNSEPVFEYFENSEEVQLSDLSSPQKGSLCSITGKICSENVLYSTTEVNQEAGGNHEQSTVKNEGSDDGPKRTKRYYKSDHIHGQSHERILRSTPVFGGKILERDGVTIWRSSRLRS